MAAAVFSSTHFGKDFTHLEDGKYILQPSIKIRLEKISSDPNGWFVPVGTILDRLEKIISYH